MIINNEYVVYICPIGNICVASVGVTSGIYVTVIYSKVATIAAKLAIIQEDFICSKRCFYSFSQVCSYPFSP